MDVARAKYLVSTAGREALAASRTLDPSDALKLSKELRRGLPPEVASAVAEQLTLSARALRNHGRQPGWLYTAEGLEMMTHPLVAERRAARLATLNLPVLDLTCGLGGDLSALVKAGVEAVGLERDRVHALLAAHNTDVPVVCGDAARPPVDTTKSALVLDPSRREGGGRRFDPAAFSPSWDVTLALAAGAKAALIKAPPGLGAEHIPPGAEVEAVQLAGSMRELTVWLGGDGIPGLQRAVLLPSGATIDSREPESLADSVAPAGYLFDPESCVTRATLVRQLAHRLDARLLDPHIAYLTASQPAFSPLAATFEVLEHLPFSLARLKTLLRQRRWRPDEIRRRAFPVEPDELRRLLGRIEGEPVALVLTTLDGQRTVFVARRLFPFA